MTSGSVAPYPSAASPSAAVSDHSRGVALVLAVLGGMFGLHRFYTGRAQSGVWMCLTFGGLGIWYLYDVIVVAAGDFEDGEGRRVARWEVGEAASQPTAAERRVTDLEDRMFALESQLSELAERLDFAERLLAQARERGALPKA